MSKALCFTLSRAAWKGTNNCYVAFRHISSTNGMNWSSGDQYRAEKFKEINSDVTTPIMSTDIDILYQNLKTAPTSATVLKLVNEHHKIMNSKHVLQALRSIFVLQKEGRTGLSTRSLLKHPDFEKLCRSLKSNAGVIDVRDAIQSLKIVSYVGVSATSTISQVLLQLIRQNINSLNIQQIIFLDFLLRTFDNSPLVEALKIALSLVFEIQLPKKMDRQNPVHMAECLQYATKPGVTQDSVDLIVRSLEKYPGEIDGKTAQSIIVSICNMNRDASYETLINKSATDLVVNLDNLSAKDMEIVLSKLAHKFTKAFPFYYQEVLFDTCANYIIDHNIDFKRAVYVLRNLARMHHFHKPLLDYVSTIIYNNPSTEQDASCIYSIAVSLVLTEYRPVQWECLKNWIRSAKDLAKENRKEIIWIRFAAALCILDIYKIDVLSRALNEKYVFNLMDKGFLSDFENYFIIWQSIQIYKPDLIDLLPSNLEPKDLVGRCKHPEEYPLEPAFQKGLGGKQFLLTNIYSKMGALIDHVIVFQRGGFPIPLERNVKFIEELKLSSDCQLVLILAMQDYHYTANTKMMRANIIKSINILEETYNCHVIPVNLPNWEELNDFEKIPYLMQRLKTKLELDLNISESVL